jgi:hypothetical protein
MAKCYLIDFVALKYLKWLHLNPEAFAECWNHEINVPVVKCGTYITKQLRILCATQIKNLSIRNKANLKHEF